MNFRRVIFSEISARYKGVDFCFLYGSHLGSRAHDASDVDVITVVSETVPPFREHFTAVSKQFDCFVFDAESLHAAMRHSYRNGNFTLVNSVIAAVPLPQPTIISDRLQQLAKEIRNFSDVRIDRQVFMTRHYLYSAMVDLMHCNDDDRFAVASGLYRLVTEGMVFHLGGGTHGVKHAGRYLQSKMGRDYFLLQQSLRDALNGERTDLISWAKATLDKLGGAPLEDFSLELPLLPRLPLA